MPRAYLNDEGSRAQSREACNRRDEEAEELCRDHRQQDHSVEFCGDVHILDGITGTIHREIGGEGAFLVEGARHVEARAWVCAFRQDDAVCD